MWPRVGPPLRTVGAAESGRALAVEPEGGGGVRATRGADRAGGGGARRQLELAVLTAGVSDDEIHHYPFHTVLAAPHPNPFGHIQAYPLTLSLHVAPFSQAAATAQSSTSISHVRPEKPSAQAHSKPPSSPPKQVPLFRQGKEEQESLLNCVAESDLKHVLLLWYTCIPIIFPYLFYLAGVSLVSRGALAPEAARHGATGGLVLARLREAQVDTLLAVGAREADRAHAFKSRRPQGGAGGPVGAGSGEAVVHLESGEVRHVLKESRPQNVIMIFYFLLDFFGGIGMTGESLLLQSAGHEG